MVWLKGKEALARAMFRKAKFRRCAAKNGWAKGRGLGLHRTGGHLFGAAFRATEGAWPTGMERRAKQLNGATGYGGANGNGTLRKAKEFNGSQLHGMERTKPDCIGAA